MKKYWERWKAKLEKRLNRLSHRQKLMLILGLLGLFVVVDFFYIWSGFSGNSNNSTLEIEHIQVPPVLKPNEKDSINLKPFEYGNKEK